MLGLVLVSGCTTDSGPSTSASSIAAPPPLLDQSVPQIAREACLREVGRTTNNYDLSIMEMIYSEANSQMKIGVGPDSAPWQCLVSNSGVVAQVMSLTNEGTL